MADIALSPQAYCKILLHAAKYPHCSVNGILLAEQNKVKDGKGLKLVDAIPLFHLALTLAPMMEVALTQIDAFCKSQGLILAGYYQANENCSNNSPNLLAYKLADKINENLPGDACLIMVDNKKLSLECKEPALSLYLPHSGKWEPKHNPYGLVEEETLAKASALLQSRCHRGLVDFDTHLDDITQDWLNPQINEQIEHSS